jgi:hypothetical protein
MHLDRFSSPFGWPTFLTPSLESKKNKGKEKVSPVNSSLMVPSPTLTGEKKSKEPGLRLNTSNDSQRKLESPREYTEEAESSFDASHEEISSIKTYREWGQILIKCASGTYVIKKVLDFRLRVFILHVGDKFFFITVTKYHLREQVVYSILRKSPVYTLEGDKLLKKDLCDTSKKITAHCKKELALLIHSYWKAPCPKFISYNEQGPSLQYWESILQKYPTGTYTLRKIPGQADYSFLFRTGIPGKIKKYEIVEIENGYSYKLDKKTTQELQVWNFSDKKALIEDIINDNTNMHTSTNHSHPFPPNFRFVSLNIRNQLDLCIKNDPSFRSYDLINAEKELRECQPGTFVFTTKQPGIHYMSYRFDSAIFHIRCDMDSRRKFFNPITSSETHPTLKGWINSIRELGEEALQEASKSFSTVRKGNLESLLSCKEWISKFDSCFTGTYHLTQTENKGLVLLLRIFNATKVFKIEDYEESGTYRLKGNQKVHQFDALIERIAKKRQIPKNGLRSYAAWKELQTLDRKC